MQDAHATVTMKTEFKVRFDDNSIPLYPLISALVLKSSWHCI